MEIFEITGYKSGISRSGVNYLQPSDSFQSIENGYINRQILQSRMGFSRFSTTKVSDGSRIMGIFEHNHVDNTTELLVISKEFLYTYNTTTNTFDQITNAGSAPVGGFGIGNNDHYVSGTTYPFPDGTNRFVFTGRGMSDVYMYDGTNVKSFTTVGDNPDYADPPQGLLEGAWFVNWFGERLNLFGPIIDGRRYPQGFLYSGIRDTGGNGDKFNVVGSGLLEGDTPEYINGVAINGNSIILNFSRSNWKVDKTRDPYNPYFITKIPSVIGTDAAFSSVTWDYNTVSLGKTGVIAADGRQSVRIDNKIPDFTTDDIDQSTFNLTYGGFDRFTDQFLFSYNDDREANTQNKVLVSNYDEGSWAVYDQSFSCFGQTDKGTEIAWKNVNETSGFEGWEAWKTTDEIWDRIGQTSFYQKTLAGSDDGFVYELNTDFDDYFIDITAITKASQAVLTTGSQDFQVGDLVVISDVEGMTQINNYDEDTGMIKPAYEVVAQTETSITLNVDSNEFDTYTTGGFLSKPINFSAETIPLNPWRDQGRRIYVSYVEFLLSTDSGHLVVDVFADEDEAPFIEGVLLQPTSTRSAREWISMSINNESDFITFKMKQSSPSVQVKLTSMRIHARAGGPSLG